ncbi:CD109 antigen [Parasteatoda tepidariorum]|uniref:CD109 antigen n=1 Tax=Parasteatoda tepidariorum TaxID=114398 RepID=UPI00077F899B|nr:CD109 antigen [Parasteatoda tepidariorum]
MHSFSRIIQSDCLIIFFFICTYVIYSTSQETRIFTAGEWDGTSDENVYLSLSGRNFNDDPRYLVIASNIVRPGQVYRVCVSILSSSNPLIVRASLHRDGEQIVSATETVNPQHVSTLLMQVPFNAIPGAYLFKVEGHLEGDLGGSGFSNETLVDFSERFLTILIQTNQLVYNLEQMMYIRIILLTTELKPFTEPIDVYIVDSRGVIMKRWVSIYPLLGVVNLEFELPYDYPEGWWTIKAVALGQTEETRVLLERWFSHRFDVNVGTDAFVLNSDEYIEGQILANYTSVATVTGNITLRTYLRPLGRYRDLGLNFKDRYVEEYVDLFHGTYDFSISMAQLRDMAMPVPLEHCEIEIQADVYERFYDFKVSAYGRLRVVNSSVSLRFLGVNPQVFKPGMPFKTHLAISYNDLVPFPEDKLETARVVVNPIVITRNGRRELNQQILSFNSDGVVEVAIDTPKNSERIIIRAYYEDDLEVGSRARTELTVLAMHSRKDRYLQISTSTKQAKAGEYAVLHVWSNFYLKSFHYLVVAKGIIVQTGTEKVMGMLHSITTFSVPVSPEMAPVFHVVVYHITADGEVLTDSVIIPIDALNKHDFKLVVNMKQERSGNYIELIPFLTSESNIGIWGFDSDHVSTHGRQQLTVTSINEAMYEFEPDHLKFHRAFWRNRDGSPEKISYYTTHNSARDTKNSFENSNLLVFTNLIVSYLPYFCNTSTDLSSCKSGQCYPTNKKCDGIRDCEDGTDEGSCFQMQLNEDKDLFEFYLYRRNRQGAFYDATAGNFAWKNKIIGEDQEEYIGTTAPKGPSAYALNAVGMNKMYGLHILPESIIFDSTKPFFIIAEGPEEAVIGEQIGIRVSVMNYQFIEIKAEIILMASDDYRFVQVEPMGIVSSYNPRTGSGELQHLIYVKPVSHAFVHIPIVATKIGEIQVTIIGRTQVAKDVAEMTITISPDGVPVHRHTSLLLDMRNEAYLIRYLDVNVTEDPIIPYEETYRYYIFDSPKASVSIIGDVVGAPFPEDPRSPIGLKALGMADAVKSGDFIMFDFAYTLLTLHYLRITNQLKSQTMRGMLEYLNKAYVYQSVFYKNGAYTMFKDEQPSLWLTALCVRMFHLAQYPDWENYLYIDPDMLSRSVEYILRYQTREGSFYEVYPQQWNRKMNVLSSNDPYINYQNISLTAHVLITLTAVADLSGDIRVDISNAKNSAVRYLERRLPQLDDPYQVAIVTYALLEAGSVESEIGFNKLDRLKREKEGMVYWSPDDIVSSEILYQNQRPFILPRLPSKYDSVAVEATAYALLVYVRYNGIITDQIVKWLNTMRTTDEGFISSQDTIVATEALIEYSFRTHVRDITSMKVSVESSSNAGKIHQMSIMVDNLAESRRIEVAPRVWGHAEIIAKGSGLSVLQLDVGYNVDRDFLLIQPPVPSFDLTVKGYYHGRNKSHMNIESCAKWTYTKESETSGVAVMEIALPTGYLIHKPDMDTYVFSRKVPRLKRGRVYPKSAVFMFDYLDTSWLCVNFTVQRWYPVANLTRYLKAKVYDYYTPERYKETIYEDFDLFVLNICEVCGSYQCPYCPYFSFAERINMQWILLLTLASLVIIINNKRLSY